MARPAKSESDAEVPVIGQYVDGIDVPVVNERAVRASAGLLFLFGLPGHEPTVGSISSRP